MSSATASAPVAHHAPAGMGRSPSRVQPLGVRVAEAADSLGVSSRTIRRMILDGRLQHIRVGRCVIVTTASLRSLLPVEE